MKSLILLPLIFRDIPLPLVFHPFCQNNSYIKVIQENPGRIQISGISRKIQVESRCQESIFLCTRALNQVIKYLLCAERGYSTMVKAIRWEMIIFS